MPLLQERVREEKDVYSSSYTVKEVESNSLAYQTKTTAFAIVVLLEMIVLFSSKQERDQMARGISATEPLSRNAFIIILLVKLQLFLSTGALIVSKLPW
jgi:hypothetical protein